MFNLRKELKTIPPHPMPFKIMAVELAELAWRCRRECFTLNGRELFEYCFEKGLIKRAWPSDQYGEYYVVTVD